MAQQDHTNSHIYAEVDRPRRRRHRCARIAAGGVLPLVPDELPHA